MDHANHQLPVRRVLAHLLCEIVEKIDNIANPQLITLVQQLHALGEPRPEVLVSADALPCPSLSLCATRNRKRL